MIKYGMKYIILLILGKATVSVMLRIISDVERSWNEVTYCVGSDSSRSGNIASEIHKVIKLIWNKGELPHQCKETIVKIVNLQSGL
jgi:hypothetical protein